MYEKELQLLGLSEKEGKVYLACLELGSDTVQNIAQKASINRPTAYLQIESLKNKGLLSELTKGKKTYYAAEAPERLTTLLNTFEEDLRLRRVELARILPNLTELFVNAGERPRVRFFEGIEGVEAVSEDFLKTKSKTIQGILNLDKVAAILGKRAKLYSRRRIAKGIHSQSIYTSQAGPSANASDPAELREAKFIAFDKFPVSTDITIYDNKVALITYELKPTAVIIENQQIADMMRALFFLIWNGA